MLQGVSQWDMGVKEPQSHDFFPHLLLQMDRLEGTALQVRSHEKKECPLQALLPLPRHPSTHLQLQQQDLQMSQSFPLCQQQQPLDLL